MPADTSVKFFHSAMPGAPSLTNVAGSMIAVLDACLVNGFGTGTVDSIVVAGGIATVTRGAGHPFEVGAVAFIQGAAPAALNGEKKILSVTATAYTFDATGVSNQTATGTITHKLAAAGWARPFGGTNLATYKPNDGAATGCVLRVDDAGTTNARVVGYEAMTDVNTGTGPFPTAAQVSGGGYWAKNGDATVRQWFLASDSRFFILYVQHGTSGSGFNSTTGSVHAFGDVLALKSPDAYAGMLACASNSINTAAGVWDLGHNGTLSTSYAFMPRGYTGLGSAVGVQRAWPMLHTTSANTYSGAGSVPFPNPADNGLYLGPVSVGELNTGVCRGTVPGFYGSPHAQFAQALPHRTEIAGVVAYPGRKFKALNNGQGVSFVDVTGPWR